MFLSNLNLYKSMRILQVDENEEYKYLALRKGKAGRRV